MAKVEMYMCDHCGHRIGQDDPTIIKVKFQPREVGQWPTWDLCERCQQLSVGELHSTFKQRESGGKESNSDRVERMQARQRIEESGRL